MSDSIMVLQNHRGEWLFAAWSIDEGTVFTLIDKHGDLMRQNFTNRPKDVREGNGQIRFQEFKNRQMIGDEC